MNDLDLCLEVVSRTCQVVNHCVTFGVEYLGNRQRYRLGSKAWLLVFCSMQCRPYSIGQTIID